MLLDQQNEKRRMQPPPQEDRDALGRNRDALQDYQVQLMLLDQQNKKRLMQANRDRDLT